MALSGVDDRAHPTAAQTEAALNRPLRILLVEDSAEDAELLQRALRREGLAAVYQRVDDPADLKAALDAGAWDVILSDYRLPGFTGLEVVAQVQARGYDGPLILVSGTIGEESVVEALKAGVHDYVLKDDLTRLSPAIRRELREA